MAIYSKSELNAANNIANSIKNDAQEAKKMAQLIDNFKNQSKDILKGESWDSVRTILEKYIENLKTREQTANELSSAIKQANTIMINSLGEEDSIDTGLIEELKNKYNQIVQNIINLQNKSENEDKENYLADYINLRNTIDKQIKKIENVITAENEAISILEWYTDLINSYNNQAENIYVSTITYTTKI